MMGCLDVSDFVFRRVKYIRWIALECPKAVEVVDAGER